MLRGGCIEPLDAYGPSRDGWAGDGDATGSPYTCDGGAVCIGGSRRGFAEQRARYRGAAVPEEFAARMVRHVAGTLGETGRPAGTGPAVAGRHRHLGNATDRLPGLYVVGRKKEVIKRGGHSVFPLEIDNVMITHPAVAEAITFAIPHDTLGEDVIAAVVGKPGYIVDSASIKQHVAEAMSSYKIPSRVLVVDSIPRNSIGKALRREMPGLLASRLAPEAVAPSAALECTLLEVWHEILRRADIGVTDNVFQFGADPLRAELAAGRIAERTGHRLTTRVLYASPSVREQAEFLGSQHTGAIPWIADVVSGTVTPRIACALRWDDKTMFIASTEQMR
jgi:hypothetical protein